ncbi:MAG: LysM peptidoglycan-binding domain-containing protein [Oscillospiraceae bacterium]|nr:LysM peptidoglycan-binding domain-containing protein [Oscillospiraceae bacterium]
MAADKVKLDDSDLDVVSGGSKLVHNVRPGDSLSEIAKTYGVTVEQLMKWNKLTDENMIGVDQKLNIRY